MIDVSGSTVEDSARHDKLNVLLRFLGASVGGSEEAYVVAFAASPHSGHRYYRQHQRTLVRIETGGRGSTLWPHSTLRFSSFQRLTCFPPSVSGRSVLVVLSDFEDNTSHQDLDRAIHDLQLKGTTVLRARKSRRGSMSPIAARDSGPKLLGAWPRKPVGKPS